MAVRLRLRRTGTKNKACYRIVAADNRSPRDGRFIENTRFTMTRVVRRRGLIWRESNTGLLMEPNPRGLWPL